MSSAAPWSKTLPSVTKPALPSSWYRPYLSQGRGARRKGAWRAAVGGAGVVAVGVGGGGRRTCGAGWRGGCPCRASPRRSWSGCSSAAEGRACRCRRRRSSRAAARAPRCGGCGCPTRGRTWCRRAGEPLEPRWAAEAVASSHAAEAALGRCSQRPFGPEGAPEPGVGAARALAARVPRPPPPHRDAGVGRVAHRVALDEPVDQVAAPDADAAAVLGAGAAHVVAARLHAAAGARRGAGRDHARAPRTASGGRGRQKIGVSSCRAGAGGAWASRGRRRPGGSRPRCSRGRRCG